MIEVLAPVTGNVWKVLVSRGDMVQGEDEMVILESMKMEIPVIAPMAGLIKELRVSEGDTVEENQVILVIGADSVA